ncbi:MAG TPA: hypothetical protein VEG28_05750, partial [Dehalococcoidia bacterium]|nr:hypothetical protein [Dehalococcoidia bacterium]
IKDKERSDALVKVKFFILIVALIAITGIVVSVFEEPYIKLSAKAKEYWMNFILIPVWVIGLVGGGIKIAMDYYKE